MPSKLTWEWLDDSQILIRKNKGMITMDEIFRFMHEREQTNIFDGALVITAFRVNSERDFYESLFHEKPIGDNQSLFIIQDDTPCPICQKNKLFPQYCPQCGTKIKVPEQEETT